MKPIPPPPVWCEAQKSWKCPHCKSHTFKRSISLNNFQMVYPDRNTFHATQSGTEWRSRSNDETLTCYECDQPLTTPPDIIWSGATPDPFADLTQRFGGNFFATDPDTWAVLRMTFNSLDHLDLPKSATDFTNEERAQIASLTGEKILAFLDDEGLLSQFIEEAINDLDKHITPNP